MGVPSDMEEILKEFLVESQENLDRLDHDLVTLEGDPASQEALASVFRTIHTVKGTCGFLGFGKLESVSHVGESLLARLRDGELRLTPEITSGLLALVDAVRAMLASIEASGEEGAGDYQALIARLTHLQHPEDAPLPVEEAPAVPAPGPAPAAAPEAAHAIRVGVPLLERLMNLAGELVLTRNRLLQLTATSDDAALTATTQRLNAVTTELQERVMETRMQPIAVLWRKLPRLVRDVAQVCGKRVRLEMTGEETELDRAVIEALKDPLTHLIRNAIDHGIEAPAAREARGKSATGRVALRALHESGQITIEIADDGGGIDPERVRARARERRLLAPEEAARLSDREALRLIFLPGLSTAEAVTTISGRGVGMDVVRANIERIGGTIDVASAPGLGTTLTIKIPLTLAIVPALIVTAGGQRYAIPESNLVELVQLGAAQAPAAIEHVHDAPVYRLRGTLLHLVFLNRALGLEPAAGPRGPAGGPVDIAVLRAGTVDFGLVVDAIEDSEEIVVKPLAEVLRGLSAYAAATILGDGGIGLILDIAGLARSAGLDGVTVASEAAPATVAAPKVEARAGILLVAAPGGTRAALPLGRVARLETIPRAAVEHAGGREVVQYRGRILPLVRLADILGDPGVAAAAEASLLPVVVCADGDRDAGLVVGRILDIVDEPLALARGDGRPGIAGAAVVAGQVTEVLDVAGVVRGAAVGPAAAEARPA
jgi:two-component system, chemotaxis family, sensor kinase CheA